MEEKVAEVVPEESSAVEAQNAEEERDTKAEEVEEEEETKDHKQHKSTETEKHGAKRSHAESTASSEENNKNNNNNEQSNNTTTTTHDTQTSPPASKRYKADESASTSTSSEGGESHQTSTDENYHRSHDDAQYQQHSGASYYDQGDYGQGSSSPSSSSSGYGSDYDQHHSRGYSPSHSQPLPESMADDSPSKVIHFRNVTAEITQEDIMELAQPFGQVEKVVMMRLKNQCLVEFQDLANAINMSNFYVNTQPQIRGRKVYMRFSRHQALTGTNINVNKVLLVTLQMDQEPTIPITADIVWHIFSTYGFIEKIVVINKGGLQALIQYSIPASGSSASQYLNGKTVYVGTDPILAITLYIQYSHLPQLTVRTNTPQARDYTMQMSYGQGYYPGYGGYDQQGGMDASGMGGGYGGMPQHQGGQGGGGGQGALMGHPSSSYGQGDRTAELYALAQHQQHRGY